MIPLLTQIWMFSTPIVYPSSMIKSDIWQSVYALNPMVGVVEEFRWALAGSGSSPGVTVFASSLLWLRYFFS